METYQELKEQDNHLNEHKEERSNELEYQVQLLEQCSMTEDKRKELERIIEKHKGRSRSIVIAALKASGWGVRWDWTFERVSHLHAQQSNTHAGLLALS